ncbi:MAG: hypothetical protein KGS45_00815 [Planctomycetes bacterium]|nr:hypothetical protein [Planctomycetota bacterium]
MSTFNGLSIFVGPHRFTIGDQGQTLIPLISQGALDPASLPIGLKELVITVTGRLVASTESALWTLRNNITALLTHPPTAADLIDDHGHTWSDIHFVAFKELAPTDRARTRSITYSATFRKLLPT